MSIRNKRLMREQERMIQYQLEWPTDWKQDVIVLYTVQRGIPITIKVGMKYPFQHPRLFIRGKTDYIEWFLNKKSAYNLNNIVHIPCVCCRNILCDWTPSYGIENIICDFLKFHDVFTLLDNFRIIYTKINGFDDLIYKNIISYLYNG
jgi:hypothetical protein